MASLLIRVTKGNPTKEEATKAYHRVVHLLNAIDDYWEGEESVFVRIPSLKGKTPEDLEGTVDNEFYKPFTLKKMGKYLTKAGLIPSDYTVTIKLIPGHIPEEGHPYELVISKDGKFYTDLTRKMNGKERFTIFFREEILDLLKYETKDECYSIFEK